jgi:tRNA(Ile)-lysidine synthase
MFKKFQNQLQQLIASPKKYRFLVAASGGLDSTVLIYLCHQFELDFGICHVNFQLRGVESDKDEAFLKDISSKLDCPIFIHSQNTKIYAKNQQLSIQVAAREIRYNWFKKCIDEEGFDYLLTAHHADDNLETYLINSFRGTGIKGLKGIPGKRRYILRPLLRMSREEILDFAQNQELIWREDQSNASDKYLRNVIRHHLIPFFQERQDDLYARFHTSLSNINRQETLLEDYLHLIFKQVVEQKESTYRIKIEALKQFPNHENILIELLKDFGFKDWDSISNLLNAQVGKYVNSNTHKLVKERGFLELFQAKDMPNKEILISLNNLPNSLDFTAGRLYFETVDSFQKTDKNTAYLSKNLLKSELCLRPYKIGDYFCPLGMQGKRKLSDFLKDEKLSTFEKSKIWVLTHKNDIVWVVNHRIDNRYKVTETTNQCLKIQFFPLSSS